MRTEIRPAGFGGQGLVLAGAILGEAAVIAGMEAVQTQSYGPESRGGAARSEVVIADRRVDYPRVVEPDILVVISHEAMLKYAPVMPKSGVCVIDTDLVKTELEGVTRVPFTKTAESVGYKIVANIVMLGYITHRFGVVPRDAIEKAILKRIPKGTEEVNMKAFQAGWDLAGGDA
jgi:2-oxoglutarate ferredoxin oxidoreductase subunit gamma